MGGLRKGQQEAEESKGRAFDGIALDGAFSAQTDMAAKLQKKKHGSKSRKASAGGKIIGVPMAIANCRVCREIKKVKRTRNKKGEIAPRNGFWYGVWRW